MTITTPPTINPSEEGFVHNAARIARGLKGLDDYAASQGGLDGQTSLNDYMTDLRHGIASRGLSLEEALEKSEEQYEEEREEGPWSE